MSKDHVYHARTKHIDVKYHIIRERVEMGEICLEYVRTDENMADVLTKGLAKGKHASFSTNLGLLPG